MLVDKLNKLIHSRDPLQILGIAVPFISHSRIKGLDKFGYAVRREIKIKDDLVLNVGDRVFWMHTGLVRQLEMPGAYTLWVNGQCTWTTMSECHPFTIRQVGIRMWMDVGWHIKAVDLVLAGHIADPVTAKARICKLLQEVWLPQTDFYAYGPKEVLYTYNRESGYYIRPAWFVDKDGLSKCQGKLDVWLPANRMVLELVEHGSVVSYHRAKTTQDRRDILRVGDGREKWMDSITGMPESVPTYTECMANGYPKVDAIVQLKKFVRDAN